MDSIPPPVDPSHSASSGLPKQPPEAGASAHIRTASGTQLEVKNFSALPPNNSPVSVTAQKADAVGGGIIAKIRLMVTRLLDAIERLIGRINRWAGGAANSSAPMEPYKTSSVPTSTSTLAASFSTTAPPARGDGKLGVWTRSHNLFTKKEFDALPIQAQLDYRLKETVFLVSETYVNSWYGGLTNDQTTLNQVAGIITKAVENMRIQASDVMGSDPDKILQQTGDQVLGAIATWVGVAFAAKQKVDAEVPSATGATRDLLISRAYAARGGLHPSTIPPDITAECYQTMMDQWVVDFELGQAAPKVDWKEGSLQWLDAASKQGKVHTGDLRAFFEEWAAKQDEQPFMKEALATMRVPLEDKWGSFAQIAEKFQAKIGGFQREIDKVQAEIDDLRKKQPHPKEKLRELTAQIVNLKRQQRIDTEETCYADCLNRFATDYMGSLELFVESYKQEQTASKEDSSALMLGMSSKLGVAPKGLEQMVGLKMWEFESKWTNAWTQPLTAHIMKRLLPPDMQGVSFDVVLKIVNGIISMVMGSLTSPDFFNQQIAYALSVDIPELESKKKAGAPPDPSDEEIDRELEFQMQRVSQAGSQGAPQAAARAPITAQPAQSPVSRVSHTGKVHELVNAMRPLGGELTGLSGFAERILNFVPMINPATWMAKGAEWFAVRRFVNPLLDGLFGMATNPAAFSTALKGYRDGFWDFDEMASKYIPRAAAAGRSAEEKANAREAVEKGAPLEIEKLVQSYIGNQFGGALFAKTLSGNLVALINQPTLIKSLVMNIVYDNILRTFFPDMPKALTQEETRTAFRKSLSSEGQLLSSARFLPGI